MSQRSHGTLPKFWDVWGDPSRGPGWVGGPSRQTGDPPGGRTTLPAVGRPSRRSGDPPGGRATLPRSRDPPEGPERVEGHY